MIFRKAMPLHPPVATGLPIPDLTCNVLPNAQQSSSRQCCIEAIIQMRKYLENKKDTRSEFKIIISGQRSPIPQKTLKNPGCLYSYGLPTAHTPLHQELLTHMVSSDS